MPWKLFEENVFNYLNQNIKRKDLNFEYIGSNDSTKGDIPVIFKNNHKFNIECKENKSQSSQFVLDIDKEKKIFIFSKRNKSCSSKAFEIIEHMNKNFDYYSKSKRYNYISNKIICKKKLLYKFVIDNLINKGSKIIATAQTYKKSNNKQDIIFFPTIELENYFNLDGIYRTKTSGSRIPSKKALLSFPFETIEIDESNKKRIFVKDKNPHIPERIGENFYLREVNSSSGLRELRILSNTKNHNVIFSLNLKKEFKKNLDNTYIKELIFQEIYNSI